MTLQHAATLLQQGRFAEAEALLARLPAAEASHPQAHFFAAIAAASLGRPDDARRRFDAAAAGAPDHLPILAARASFLASIGDTAAALAAWHQVTTRHPGHAEGWYQLALAALRAEDWPGAAAALAGLRRLAPADPRLPGAEGRLAQGQGRPAEAAGHFRAALVVQPGDAVSRHNLAGALRSLEQPDAALAELDRLVAAGFTPPETLLMRANVLADLGRFDAAVAQYRALLAAHPGLVAGQQALAALLPQLGRGGEALDALAAALPTSQDPALWRAAIAAAQAQEDGARMAEWARAAASRFGDPDSWAEALATGLMLSGDRNGAMRVAMAAAPSPGIRYRRAWLALAAGDLGLAETEALAVQDLLPDNQWGWSLLSIIWRLTGDRREAWLIDYDRMVTARDLVVPPGWPDLPAFLADLAPNLTARHKVLAAPADQSLRGGTQTRGNLFDSPDPLIVALRQSIRATIRGWLADLPATPGHPFLGRLGRHTDDAGDIRFTGSWSVRLRRDGFHIHHVHPQGWLSSALYIAIPPGVADPDRPDGKLAFGVPEARLGIDLPPRRLVVPAPGRLALFPSYCWHGTLPFAEEAVRMTVAFDAVPG